MLELEEQNTLAYLQSRGDIPDLDEARVQLLGWGVSNVVLRVIRPHGEDLIIKQSRVQLRTKTEWFSRLDRIYREIGMLRVLGSLLPAGVVPRLLFEDRENYLFGMEAFPADHIVWKQALLEGKVDLTVGERLGDMLAMVHAGTAGQTELAQAWGDLEVFDQLRLDPFYRYLSRVRPEARTYLEQLVAENLATASCLVLADFSPKNILLSGSRLAIVDFETGHYGDPAFDLGFFLSHLLLKSIKRIEQSATYFELCRRFWRHYQAGLQSVSNVREFQHAHLFARTMRHLAACMWARIDGKSPVDYLTDESQRKFVRELSLNLFQNPPTNWEEVFARVEVAPRLA